MKQMNMTVKFHPMYAAANMLGYGLPFMNEICKRAYISGRPFLVAKNEDGKYFVEANSLQRYIDTCPDFNPYEIPASMSRIRMMTTRRWTIPSSC